MRQTVRWVVSLVLLATLLTSCANGNDGSLPGDDSGAATAMPRPTFPKPSPASTPSASVTFDDRLAQLDPCSLLTTAELQRFHITGSAKPPDNQSCKWRARRPNETYFYLVSVLPNFAITDVPACAKPTPDIGRHHTVACSGLGGPGTCTVVVGISKVSRVDFTVVAGLDTRKSCALARQMATIVEPKLP